MEDGDATELLRAKNDGTLWFRVYTLLEGNTAGRVMGMMPGVPRMTRHDASTDGALRRSKKEQTDDGLSVP